MFEINNNYFIILFMSSIVFFVLYIGLTVPDDLIVFSNLWHPFTWLPKLNFIAKNNGQKKKIAKKHWPKKLHI